MSKVISKNSVTAAKRWDNPAVSTPGLAEKSNAFGGAGRVTAEQIDKIQNEAYAEGFERGKAEGVTAGQQEINNHVASLNQIMNLLNHPLEELDNQVEESLVQLCILMVKQLVRREIKLDPGQIIGVVREAIGHLPLSIQNIQVILNPEDALLVRESLKVSGEEPRWQIVEDPIVARGGCRIATESSQIDATLECRINTVIANVLGDERHGEADPENA